MKFRRCFVERGKNNEEKAADIKKKATVSKGKGKSLSETGNSEYVDVKLPNFRVDHASHGIDERRLTLYDRLPLLEKAQYRPSLSIEESQKLSAGDAADCDAEPTVDSGSMQNDLEESSERIGQDTDTQTLTTPVTEDSKFSSYARRGGFTDQDAKYAEALTELYRTEVVSPLRRSTDLGSREWANRTLSHDPSLPSVSNPGVYLSPAGYPPGSSRFPMCDLKEADDPSEVPLATSTPLGGLSRHMTRLLTSMGMGPR